MVVSLLPLNIGEHDLQCLLDGLFQSLQRLAGVIHEVLELVEVAQRDDLLGKRWEEAGHVLGERMVAKKKKNRNP